MSRFVFEAKGVNTVLEYLTADPEVNLSEFIDRMNRLNFVHSNMDIIDQYNAFTFVDSELIQVHIDHLVEEDAQLVPTESSVLANMGLRVTGVSQEKCEELADYVLSKLTCARQEKIQADYETELRLKSLAYSQLFNQSRVFSDMYLNAISQLTEKQQLPARHVKKGLVFALSAGASFVTVNYDPRVNTYHLLNRVKGNYQGFDVDLSLLYMTGNHAKPVLYGFIASSGQADCASKIISNCDLMMSAAGYFIDCFFVGGRLKSSRTEPFECDLLMSNSDCLPSFTQLGTSRTLDEQIKKVAGTSDYLLKDVSRRPVLQALTRLAYNAAQSSFPRT